MPYHYNYKVMSSIVQNSNLQNVLNCVYKMESPTRARIAQRLGLSRTALTSLVNELFELDLLSEKETEEHKNGRPGVILSPNTTSWFACGASFDQNTWSFVILNLLGEVVYRRQVQIDPDPIKTVSSDYAVSCLVDTLPSVLQQCPGKLLPMIGIGVPGFIDKEQGMIEYASDLGWRNVRISKAVEDAIGLPVTILNRHMTSGLAESRIGAGIHTKDMVYLGISTGLIACNFSDGDFLIGSNYNLGEVGHTIIDPYGTRCSCGKKGCLQAVASQTALCNNIRSHYGDSWPFSSFTPSLEEIYDIATNNPESICAKELSVTIRYIGILCSNLFNLFNPDRIVIGGPVSALFKGILLDELERVITESVVPHHFDKSMIKTSTLQNWGSSIGAGLLVLDNILSLVFIK